MLRIAGNAAPRPGHERTARPKNQRNHCPAPVAKIFSFPFDPNHRLILCCLIPHEGTLAIVTNVGMGCGGRRCAFDEQRVRWTAKSCGPDAPMLASSSQEARFLRATVARKPITGESSK